ncbi:AraC-type DNA-binding protein [Sphingomonas palmae]|uniref:AraC-type DNA-binding protein n=1 Tax=Sphingomonas palmae TaxID=1855283 RepID=A0A1H7T4R0_9SPHN|nr:AraC family transcriptional regulator [Sphingomonas palmae]SEL79872.1 AraC-type DNA-binding protein [Sphingomonas palmae]
MPRVILSRRSLEADGSIVRDEPGGSHLLAITLDATDATLEGQIDGRGWRSDEGTDRVTFTPAGVVRTITMASGRYDSLLVELPAALVQRVCRTNRRTAWRSASSEHNAKLALAARWYAEQACEDAEEDALLVRLLARTVARNFSTIRFRADDAWLAPSTLSRIARLATANHRACLPALAQEAGLSVSAFSRAFRGAIGLTAGDWLIERRITAAERMLIETDLPLTEVARSVGIRAASHFSQTFLARRGMPPSEFRRRARGQTVRVSGSSTPGEYRRLGR